jgi:hypothetical protein
MKLWTQRKLLEQEATEQGSIWKLFAELRLIYYAPILS